MIDEKVPKVPGMRSLERRACLQWALSALLAGAASQALAQGNPPRMKVGFITRYLPYSFVQPDGRLTGFDVEVVKALLEVSGYELEPVTDTLTNLRKKMQTG
jgi:ABC-type amino acid transport substrate-binding protein